MMALRKICHRRNIRQLVTRMKYSSADDLYEDVTTNTDNDAADAGRFTIQNL